MLKYTAIQGHTKCNIWHSHYLYYQTLGQPNINLAFRTGSEASKWMSYSGPVIWPQGSMDVFHPRVYLEKKMLSVAQIYKWWIQSAEATTGKYGKIHWDTVNKKKVFMSQKIALAFNTVFLWNRIGVENKPAEACQIFEPAMEGDIE